MICLGVFLLGSSFFGTLWVSWTSWKSISFARLGKFSFIICSNKFSIFLFFLFSFWHPYNSDVERFKMSWRFLSLSSFFWILVSSFFSGWIFLSSFWSTLLIWVPVSFPSLLVPCTFSFVSLSVAFIFSSNLQPNSTNSVSFLITSVLNCASDRLAICSCCLVELFLELWTVLSFGSLSFFFVSARLDEMFLIQCY